jgi:hypothetical protein
LDLRHYTEFLAMALEFAYFYLGIPLVAFSKARKLHGELFGFPSEPD